MANNDPHGPWYEDGYMGGAELPSDSTDLDPMLFPERPGPPALIPYVVNETVDEYHERMYQAACHDEHERLEANRRFVITEESALGERLHPPTAGNKGGQ